MKLEHNKSDGIVISKGLIFINAISSILSRIINIGLLIWLQQYLVKRISPEEYSLYPVFMSILMFLLISKSIFTGGIVRYVAIARVNNNDKRITEIITNSFFISLIFSFIIFCSGFVVVPFIDKILNIDSKYIIDAKIMMAVVIISFSLRLLLSSFECGLIVDQKFIKINIVSIITTIFRLLILFLLITYKGPKALWVIIATELSNILLILILSLLSKRSMPALAVKKKYLNFSTMKELITFGLWTFVGQVANRIKTASDPIVLNKLSNAYEVSCFYLGNIIPKNLNLLILQASQTFLSSIAAMYETKQYDKLSRTFLKYGRYVSWIFLAISIPVILFYQEIMILYAGNQYLKAGYILLILMITESLEHFYGLISRIANVMGKIRSYSIITLCSQLLNLTLTIILVGVYNLGSLGAAISSLTIRAGVEFLIFPIFSTKLLNISIMVWFKETLIRGISPCIIISCIMIFIKEIYFFEGWIQIMMFTLTSILFYFILIITIFSKKEDRDDLRLLIKSFQQKIKGKQI